MNDGERPNFYIKQLTVLGRPFLKCRDGHHAVRSYDIVQNSWMQRIFKKTSRFMVVHPLHGRLSARKPG